MNTSLQCKVERELNSRRVLKEIYQVSLVARFIDQFKDCGLKTLSSKHSIALNWLEPVLCQTYQT